MRSALAIGTLMAAAPALAANTNLEGLVKVCDTHRSCPTGSVATADGELLVEGDLEVDGNINFAGDMTLTGNDLTFGNGGTVSNATNGAITLGEASEDLLATFTANLVTFSSSTGATVAFTPAVALADSLTFSDGAVVDQAANGSLSIVEGGETLSFDFTANLVDIDANGSGASITLTTASTLLILNAGIDAGWTAPTGANTACATTCAGTGACLFGLNTGGVLVACADATADSCVCGGPAS